MNNKKKSWLYLPVEVKVRELDAKLLLAYYAAKEGYRVIIGEHKMVELAAQNYPAGIFFSKGYPNRFRKRIITTAVKHKHKIVELDEEGLIIHHKTDYLQDRMQTDMLQLVSQEYCWGPHQKDLITNSMNNVKKKCFTTGNPRFDLLTRKFQVLYEDDATQLQNKYGPYILINTRFSLYNSILGPKTNDEHARYIKALYDHFIPMIHAVAKQFPHTNIIIRPHPSENMNTYKKEFASKQNVHVIHDGNIVKWILAADVIVHHGCTSSIEAFLLEKPVITYAPVTSTVYDIELPNLLGVTATKIGELLDLLQNNITISPKIREKLLVQKFNTYCKWSQTDFAYKTILSLLKSLETRPTNAPQVQKRLVIKENKHVKHFFPFLSKREIETFFQRLDAIEHCQSKFIVKGLGKNVYCIEFNGNIS